MNSAVVIPVELPKPTDYMAIYRIADAELSKLRHRATGSDTQLCLHLSPGTPAMAAVWALLGKTRDPAKFLETFAGKSWVTDIPFDLTIDVLPELLRDPDCHWQHLAAEGPQDVAGFEDIAGESRVICDAAGRAKRAALRGVSILLLGESGTGKEMFAHAIHKASPRRDRPFVAINCATLSKTLLESSAAADSAMSKGRVPERIVIGRTRSSRPPVNRGELLCTFSAGAYRTTMSSNYNSRPRAIELLIDGDQVKVIRRREIYDDLIAAELV